MTKQKQNVTSIYRRKAYVLKIHGYKRTIRDYLSSNKNLSLNADFFKLGGTVRNFSHGYSINPFVFFRSLVVTTFNKFELKLI